MTATGLLTVLAQLQLSGPPIAQVGVVDGDTMQTLYNVVRVAEDRRGNVYVVQNGTPYVAVFDSLGRRIATLGRGGSGPGEFELPISVSFAGDSIWIADSGRGKFAVFGAGFEHVRDVFVGSVYRTERGGDVRPIEVLADGSMLVTVMDSLSRMIHVRRDGQAREVTVIPVGAYTARVAVGGRTVHITKPVTTHPVPVVVGDRIHVMERSHGEAILLRPAAGGPVVRVDGIPRYRVTPADARELLRGFVEGAKSRTPSVSTTVIERVYLEAAELPAETHYVTGYISGADGRLWLRQEPPQPRSSVFYDVDPHSGRVRASFTVPPGQRVMSIRADAAWVLETDGDGVPFLRRYRLGAKAM